MTAFAGALSFCASLLTSIRSPASSSSCLAASFDLPTTFGTSTVRPRTARYVIVPALIKKTPANSAAVSKLLKILLEPSRESKRALLKPFGVHVLEFPFGGPPSGGMCWIANPDRLKADLQTGTPTDSKRDYSLLGAID